MYKNLVTSGVSGTAAAQQAEMAALTGGALQSQVLELQAQLEAERAAHAATKAALDAATATGGV